MLDAKGCKTDLPISMFTDYSTDDKIKLQAFAQLNKGYNLTIDLTPNGVVVTDAIDCDQSKMDYLNKIKNCFKKSRKIEKSD
jgi:hypothetical protein